MLIRFQDVDQIHALEGMVSLSATGASSVKGGNWQIFENFIAASEARLYLNTTVSLSWNIALRTSS